MHGLVVAHGLLEVELILLVHLGSERRVRLLCALPRRAFVVQVASVTLLNELKLLSGFREGLARRDLFRTFKSLTRLAVNLAIVGTSPMAGFAAHTYQELVRLRNFIPAFHPEPSHVAADTILVLDVVLLRVEFRLDHGFVLFLVPVGFERVDSFGVGGLDPRVGLTFVTITAFLPPLERRLGGSASD